VKKIIVFTVLLLISKFTLADTQLDDFPEGQRPQISESSTILADDMNVMFNYLSQLRLNNSFLSSLNFVHPEIGDTFTKSYVLTELYKNSEIYPLGTELDLFLVNPDNSIYSTELNSLFNKVMDDVIEYSITCPDLHVLNNNNVCIPDPSFGIEIYHQQPQERSNIASVDYITNWNEMYTYNDFMGGFSDLGSFTSQGYSFLLEVNCYETIIGECGGDTSRKVLIDSNNFSDFSSNLFEFGSDPFGIGSTYVSLGETPQEFTLTITNTNLNESASFTRQIPNYSEQVQVNIENDGDFLISAEQSDSPTGVHDSLELFYLKKGNNFKFDLRSVVPETDRYGNEFVFSQTRLLLNDIKSFQRLSAFIPSANEPRSRADRSRIYYDPATNIANTSIHEFEIRTDVPDGWVSLETRFYGSNYFLNRERILFFLGDTDPAKFNGMDINTFNYQNYNIDSVDVLANLNLDVSDPEGINSIKLFPSLEYLLNDEAINENIPAACIFSDPSTMNIRFRYDLNTPIENYSDNMGECVFNILDRNQTNIYVVVTDNQGEKTYENFDIFFEDGTPTINLLANENDTSVTYNQATNISLTWNSSIVDNCTTQSSPVTLWNFQDVNNNEGIGFDTGIISATTLFTINCESLLDQSIVSDSVEVIIDLLCSEVANTNNIGDYNNGGSCTCLSGYSWDNTSNTCQLIENTCDSSQIIALGGDPSLAATYSGTYTILDNSQCRIASCSIDGYDPTSDGLSCEQTAVSGTVQINAIDPISNSAFTNGSRPINITWSTTNITNPTSQCVLYSSPNFGWLPNFSAGNSSIIVTQNTTFVISCTDDLGQNVSDSSFVNYIPTNISLSANLTTLNQPNQSFQINLDYNGIENGTCTASNNAGDVNWSGNINNGIVNLTGLSTNGTYRYEVSCPGINGGTYTDFVDIIVDIAEGSVQLLSDKTEVNSSEESINLTWTTSNVTNCQAFEDWSGTKSENGNESISGINNNATYTLTCEDLLGQLISSSVNITTNFPNAVLTINTSPSVFNQTNQSTTITWSATNVETDSCYASSDAPSSTWVGLLSGSGSTVVPIPNVGGTYTYTLTCFDYNGLEISENAQVLLVLPKETQRITFTKETSTGPLVLSYKGESTTIIPAPIIESNLQNALNSLSTISADGGVNITNSFGVSYNINFNQGGNFPEIQIESSEIYERKYYGIDPEGLSFFGGRLNEYIIGSSRNGLFQRHISPTGLLPVNLTAKDTSLFLKNSNLYYVAREEPLVSNNTQLYVNNLNTGTNTQLFTTVDKIKEIKFYDDYVVFGASPAGSLERKYYKWNYIDLEPTEIVPNSNILGNTSYGIDDEIPASRVFSRVNNDIYFVSFGTSFNTEVLNKVSLTSNNSPTQIFSNNRTNGSQMMDILGEGHRHVAFSYTELGVFKQRVLNTASGTTTQFNVGTSGSEDYILVKLDKFEDENNTSWAIYENQNGVWNYLYVDESGTSDLGWDSTFFSPQIVLRSSTNGFDGNFIYNEYEKCYQFMGGSSFFYQAGSSCPGRFLVPFGTYEIYPPKIGLNVSLSSGLVPRLGIFNERLPENFSIPSIITVQDGQ
jgi:hypothetical protein